MVGNTAILGKLRKYLHSPVATHHPFNKKDENMLSESLYFSC